MTFKQFLKPDWRKIAITAIMFIFFVFFLTYSIYSGGVGFSFGFPIHTSRNPSILEQIYISIIDLVFWYLLSCLIIWIYDKFRKKKVK